VERRPRAPTALVIAAPVTAATVALVTTALFLALTGVSVPRLAGSIFLGAFGSPGAVANVIVLAAPLMLTGLATSLTFRVGLINLGVEGQVVAAALAGLLASSGAVPMPSVAMIPLAIIAALVTGALSVSLVTVLRLRFAVDEAVLTLVLNVVMLFALQLMAGSAISSLPPIGSMQPLPLANAFGFPDWGPALHRYLEPFVAVVACLLAFAIIRFTIWGLDMRAAGGSVVAARFAGIQVSWLQLHVALMSGVLIGVAAVGQVLSAGGGSTPALTLGLGYAGIAVAFLAAFEPLGVIPAALFIATLLVGFGAASQKAGVPLSVGNVTIALMLIAALIARSTVRYQLRLHRGSETSQ
jgi:simple sugar transport system permease protein